MARRFGFTLAELLMVIVIVMIITGIATPVLLRAKGAAKAEVGKQYLRQQYLALSVYAGSWEDHFPAFETVKNDRQMQAPCSPADYWKQPCWSRSEPMLGSFAYIDRAREELPEVQLVGSRQIPLLADVFSSDYHLGEFEGATQPDATTVCPRSLSCEFPERIWFAWSDGSLRVQKHRRPPRDLDEASGRGTRLLFNWPTAFLLEMQRNRDHE